MDCCFVVSVKTERDCIQAFFVTFDSSGKYTNIRRTTYMRVDRTLSIFLMFLTTVKLRLNAFDRFFVN